MCTYRGYKRTKHDYFICVLKNLHFYTPRIPCRSEFFVFVATTRNSGSTTGWKKKLVPNQQTGSLNDGVLARCAFN